MAQSAMINAVNAGPAMTAQRQALQAMFGDAARQADTAQAAQLKTPALASQGSSVAQLWPPKMSGHAQDRAVERGVTEAGANAAMGGTKYDDPDYPGGTVYHDPGTGTAVCTVADGTVTTVYIQPNPKARWTPK